MRIIRHEGPRVLAGLVRMTGSWEVAEDAVQDATVKALQVWRRDGIPPEPRAWLIVVARNRAVDLLRRESGRMRVEAAAEGRRALLGPVETDDEVVDDDLLRLLFTCCHPSLTVEAQAALALRTVCGLTTTEVARALVVAESTLAKRLTRARRKIAVAGIPYRRPSGPDLPRRLAGVLTILYLLFTEGYSATSGEDPIRSALTAEAIRLTRLVNGLIPGEPGVTGLLALMLLQDSRRPARLDNGRELILLADQDRSRWDRAAITEGMSLLGSALRRTPVSPDPYVTQAAIAACHAIAPTWQATNWGAVVSWYDVLLGVTNTAVVRLNRAVAVGELRGPQAGLEALPPADALPGVAALPAARAEFLHRLGRKDEASTEWRAALALPGNRAQRAYLLRRLGGDLT